MQLTDSFCSKILIFLEDWSITMQVIQKSYSHVSALCFIDSFEQVNSFSWLFVGVSEPLDIPKSWFYSQLFKCFCYFYYFVINLFSFQFVMLFTGLSTATCKLAYRTAVREDHGFYLYQFQLFDFRPNFELGWQVRRDLNFWTLRQQMVTLCELSWFLLFDNYYYNSLYYLQSEVIIRSICPHLCYSYSYLIPSG